MITEDIAREYYSSDAFAERQKLIAKGELMPRLYIETCRWTTFLKYCAADFHEAFKQIGCESMFVVEQNDVQFLTQPLMWKNLSEFRPDAIFMVSFARSCRMHAPKELPFIGYMQDKCGPTLVLPNLADHVTNQDLFACMYSGLKFYLMHKGVPENQVFVMPVPASEKMFYPLDEGFNCDISFVNHGKYELHRVFADFLEQDCDSIPPLVTVFTEVFKQTCFNADKRIYEHDIHDFVQAQFTSDIGEDHRHSLTILTTSFYVKVYQFAFRSEMLLELVDNKIDLAIYGNGWEKHERLKKYAHGPLLRDISLNNVYNHSRINLNIHPMMTMHQRVSECGLAGGFMLVADHDEDHDQCNARDYYEDGKEIVFFDTKKELVEKCRYYLVHETERLEIAERMHKRSVRERTCTVAALKLIEEWRKLLLSVKINPVPHLKKTSTHNSLNKRELENISEKNSKSI
ncbi:MAG: glycosyltransferase [Planctomycetota bacterium]